MRTTLANQLRRINLANRGAMQSTQVVTLKSGQQNASSVDAKSPMILIAPLPNVVYGGDLERGWGRTISGRGWFGLLLLVGAFGQSSLGLLWGRRAWPFFRR